MRKMRFGNLSGCIICLGFLVLVLLLAGGNFRAMQEPQKTAAAFTFPTENGRVDAAEYVACIALSEIKPTVQLPEESIKAICIMMNTNCWYTLQREEKLAALDCGRVKAQYRLLYEAWYAAASECIGTLILYDGMPIYAAYFASGFGITEKAENAWGMDIPYLANTSGYDMGNPEARQTFVFTKEEVKNRLGADGAIRIVSRSEAGRVMRIKVGEQQMSGTDFAKAMGLSSVVFTITEREGQTEIECIGRGDGVGLSIFGAVHMGEMGYTAEEVLRHYYRGVLIADIRKMLC